MKDKVALTQAFVAKFQHKVIMKYQRPIYHWCVLTYIVSIDSSSSIRGSVMLQSTPSISNLHLTKWESAVVFQVFNQFGVVDSSFQVEQLLCTRVFNGEDCMVTRF